MPEPCRDACRAEGEPLAGSAGTARALVAIAWPKPLWHHDDALLSSGLPGELRDLAARLARDGGKLAFRVFQRDARPSERAVEAIVWTPSDDRVVRAVDLPLERLARFVDDALAGRAPATPLAPVLLVCTDGRHDRCCATHGRAVYEAIAREAAARGAGFDVAQSSHLGGHRFAATCLLLPGGLFHGRLAPEDAPPLVAALAAARPWVARFRGRFGRAEPEQVAEAWAHARFADVEDLRVSRDADDGREVGLSLRLRTGGRERALRVRLGPREYLSCTSCDEEPPQRRDRLVVLGAQEIAS